MKAQLFKVRKHTPFTYATVVALIVGVASIINLLADLYWLIGDMAVQVHPHHKVVMVGLLGALVVFIGSFVYLHLSIKAYNRKMLRRQREKHDRIRARHYDQPNHCDKKTLHKQKKVRKYTYRETTD